MNQRQTYFFFVFLLCTLAIGQSAHAQLLEDRNKLKTATRKRQGFKPFKKNITQPSTKNRRPDVMKAASPRTTKDIAGRSDIRNVMPRFSERTSGRREKGFATPRTSSDIAGRYEKRSILPRFTQDKAGEYKKVIVIPRFTQGKAGEYEQQKISPRFTQDHAGSGLRYNIRPRFSVSPGADKIRKIHIRYSAPPSYIEHPAGGPAPGFIAAFYLRFKQNKHHQSDHSYFFGPLVKSSIDSPNSMAKHNQSLESYQKYISKGTKKSPHYEQANFVFNSKKQRKVRNSHPSANYLYAKHDGSPVIRETKRKISVTWVRIFGNETQPNGVSKRVGKVKFDKDEKDIWNNKEREYTRK